MAKSELPVLELARIKRYAVGRVPSALRSEIRVEVEVTGSVVTLVETRAPWRPEYGPVWSRTPIARLKYSPTNQTWTLFWSDSNGRWHHYRGMGPVPHVEPLLEEIERDPTAIFWG
jgi:hypothetical protein